MDLFLRANPFLTSLCALWVINAHNKKMKKTNANMNARIIEAKRFEDLSIGNVVLSKSRDFVGIIIYIGKSLLHHHPYIKARGCLSEEDNSNYHTGGDIKFFSLEDFEVLEEGVKK